ncbi:MAG: hypothetical protein ACM3WU_11555 [Bacillota bacterium]
MTKDVILILMLGSHIISHVEAWRQGVTMPQRILRGRPRSL